MHPEPQVGERLSEASLRRRQAHQKRHRSHFLRGPIPVAWLARATVLPGCSLAVGLAVWYSAGRQRKQTGLSICNTLLGQFAVQRVAGYRGLRALEQAGLVKVERHRGRCPRVAILSANRKVVDNSANSR